MINYIHEEKIMYRFEIKNKHPVREHVLILQKKDYISYNVLSQRVKRYLSQAWWRSNSTVQSP